MPSFFKVVKWFVNWYKRQCPRGVHIELRTGKTTVIKNTNVYWLDSGSACVNSVNQRTTFVAKLLGFFVSAVGSVLEAVCLSTQKSDLFILEKKYRRVCRSCVFLQSVQWQFPYITGSPLTWKVTSPQRHLPLFSPILFLLSTIEKFLLLNLDQMSAEQFWHRIEYLSIEFWMQLS